MATMMELVQPREWQSANGSGTEWVRLGKAWVKDDGTASLEFSALPIPTLKDGKLETRVLMRFPKAKDDAPRNGTPARNNRAPVDDLDEIPFIDCTPMREPHFARKAVL